jgi:transcription elongation GreA/GreB family factor
MSRAFVKEQDGAEVEQDLPELVVSPHRNLVTPDGLEQIDAEVHRLREALTGARAAEDGTSVARYSRDLRYWTRRRGSAEVVPPPDDATRVRFGSTVVLQPEQGPSSTFRIVGEDEADLKLGLINISSPIARALIGKEEGDTAEVQAPSGVKRYEIIAVRYE